MITARAVAGVSGMAIGFILLGYSSLAFSSLAGGFNAFSDLMIMILTLYAATDIVEKLVAFYIKRKIRNNKNSAA